MKMIAHAAAAPQLYGLPKIHKDNVPLRPISASMKVPCYELAKHIGTILKNIVTTTYNVNNAMELKHRLIGAEIDDNEIMVSFDVVSLFTNIPIHLAIRNIFDKWQHIKEHTKIEKPTFLKILNFCLTENNYFSINNKFYRQLYGMPMGNPLSPTIANIVLDTLLDDVVEELKTENIKIRFLTKYVDDLFAIINKNDEQTILRTLNAYHNKIKFTVEKEIDGRLPYLDVNIIRENGKIGTNWYTKPTSSGRLINYYSNQPMKMKKNTVTNLIGKVLDISEDKYKQTNMKKIRNILKTNDYPIVIINKLINSALKTRKNRREKQDSVSETTKHFYSVPFIPKLTEMKTLKGIITDDTTTIAYKSNSTLRQLFTNNKPKMDKLKTDNVVYEIKCDGNEGEMCNMVYIGTTKRMLGTRINEHKTDIRNGKISTALSQHVKECNHVVDFDNVKILDIEKKENKRYTLESLRIQQKIRTTMNTKEDKDNTKLQYSSAINN